MFLSDDFERFQILESVSHQAGGLTIFGAIAFFVIMPDLRI